MKCPYCDSRVSPVPDNRICPYCGGSLGEPEELRFPTPPLWDYKQPIKYVEVEKDRISFRFHFLGVKDHYTILYEDIAAVRFEPATKASLGFLSVRDWRNRHVPFPNVHQDASKDKTSVVFGDFFNERFQQLYEFLKQCVEIADKLR